MLNFSVLLALVPFLLFLILLLGKKTSLLIASLSAFLATLALSFAYWQIKPEIALNSFLKGFFIAFDIFLIIFGAVFFLEILKKLGIIESLCLHLESFSKDYRVQVILLAWFLENFIEGTAGFGTPAAIAAPLLITIGLSPITAVTVALLGNSTAGVFGAAGTPIRVGFSGLPTAQIPLPAAIINCLGFLVPVFMLWTITRGENRKDHFFEALPFALWSGLIFVVPSAVTVFLGQEFPSILGALIGLFLVLLSIKLKFLLPKEEKTLRPGTNSPPFHWSKVFFPYGLLIFLLVIGKFFLTGGFSITLFSGIKHTIAFFNPGLAFILAALPVAFFDRQEKNFAWGKIKFAFKKALDPFWVILCMSAMVQLMINSGSNFSGLPSFLQLMARGFETRLLPFFSPFVGAFGSFITGSVTISNLMFGNFLKIASEVMKFNFSYILALELVGAAAGNMIALADILSAETVVGLKHEERKILKGVILPCLIYVLLVGIVGLLFYSR